jgi:hypothetical protein
MERREGARQAGQRMSLLSNPKTKKKDVVWFAVNEDRP